MLQSALEFLVGYQYFLVVAAAVYAALMLLKKVYPAAFKNGNWFHVYKVAHVIPPVVCMLGGLIPNVRPEGMEWSVGMITGFLFGSFASWIYKFVKNIFTGKDRQ